jgi:hypothetical protein
MSKRTGYLSLTRGDGARNLIGPQLRELLGVIRTQELIEARKLMVANSFSRANDFDTQNPRRPCKSGIKKSTIRCGVEFQPDVIINRFDHRTVGTTHGHHTASAILSTESFNLANDPTVFPIN